MLSVVLTALWLLRTSVMRRDSPAFERPWDHHKYLELAAGNPFDFHIAPYCWRFGNSLVAKLLPFGLETSFLSIAFVGIVLAGLLSWAIAREVGFSPALSLTGVLFFYSLQWGPKFFLYDFWLPDTTLFMLVLLAVLLLIRGNMPAFVIVTTLGVTVKESMLFVLPLAYTFRATRLIDLPTARETIKFAALPILTFVGIRLAIPAWNDDPTYVASLPEKLWLVRDGGAEYDVLVAFRQEIRNRISSFDLAAARAYSIGTFGAGMTLLPLLALRANRDWFIRFLPFLLLVASQMLFGHDIERYLILAFPAVLIMALNGIAKICEAFEIPEIACISLPLTLTFFELTLISEFFLPFRFQLLALLIALIVVTVIRHLLPYQRSQTLVTSSDLPN